MKQLVSVLIVTYNSSDYIRSCVESFLQVKTDVELIIVDNRSKDDTVDVVKGLAATHPALQIQLIANQDNKGFSRAMNQAFKVSKGDFVVTFNPDAEVFPNTIDEMVKFLQAHPEAGKVGVPNENTGGGIEYPTTEFVKTPPMQLMKAFRRRAEHGAADEEVLAKEWFEVDWLYGTGFMIKREVIKGNELYPEKSFLFWEEYYLSKKVIDAGYKLYVLPHVFIRHHVSTSFKYNFSKLYMARLLSFAHEYQVRSEHYGFFNAFSNMFLYAVDYGLLGSYLSIKKVFRKDDPQLLFTLADYKARFKSSVRILFSNKRKIVAIDKETMAFFNNI